MQLNKRATKALIGLVTVAAATATVLTGCSAQGGGGSQTLTYWSMWKQGEPQQVVLSKAITAFTKQTGIAVKVQWAGRDVIKQVVPRQAAGNPPDLFDQAGSGIASAFAATDGVQGLQDVYDASPTGESEKIRDVVPSAVANLYKTKQGQPLLVPYELTGNTIWYNDLNSDVAANPPKTWDDFMALADELKAHGKPAIAVDGDQSYYEAYWYVLDAVRHGGAKVLSDAAKDKTGAAVDNPAILAAAKDIFALTQGGYLPSDFNGTKWPVQQTAWADGSSKTSFLAMGGWAPSETGAALQKSGVDVASTIKYRSIPFPAAADGKGNDVAWVDDFGFAIPAKAKHADAAKKFIEFFLAKPQLTGISTVALNVTSRSDIPAPAGLTDLAAEIKASAAANALSTDADGGQTNGQWSGTVLDATVADLFNKKFASPEAFVAALKSRTIDFFKTQG